MKRNIAFIITIVMLICASIPVFSAQEVITTVPDEASADVIVGLDAEGISGFESVYYVTIDWEDYDFIFSATDGTLGTWDPSIHKYDGISALQGSWNQTKAKFTVTNHSDAEVSSSATLSGVADNVLTVSPIEDPDLYNAAIYAYGNPQKADFVQYEMEIKNNAPTGNDFGIGAVVVELS